MTPLRTPRRRRAQLGALVLLLWLAGLGLLVRREYFRPRAARLAEAGMRVTPNALFYAVMQGDQQIGFASSTIDTAKASISADEYLTSDLPVGGRTHRATAHTHVVLDRAFHTQSFIATFEADGGMSVSGRVTGDSVLALRIETGGDTAAEQRQHLNGPILLPTLVPLAIALGESPSVGKRYTLSVFDPIGMTPREIAIRVRAESSIVVHDSSVFDGAANRWRATLPDTLHAWQLETEPGAGGAAFSGWVDDQGRVVQTSQLGLELRRQPYEVAFENWRIARGAAAARHAPVSRARDILETTAIAANRTPRDSVEQLRVVLENANLAGFALSGGRQQLRGDTLLVTQEGPRALQARYVLPFGTGRSPLVRAEPLIQSDAPEIRRLAARIVGGEQDPLTAAQRINTWVHDSLRKKVTVGIPDALRVLHARAGDCNEHTQLYVALARAAGLPARVAAGLAYADGKFYYHAWPEVLLGTWVAVDPTFGQFPADAAHLRFTVGGLGREAELLRLMGRLKVRIID